MNIILIAPPAGGKGTIASFLKEKHNFVHISTGNLIREEISKNGKLAKKLKELVDDGKLVDDEIVYKLLSDKLKENKNEKFIFDGFPRNIEQLKEADKIFEKLNLNDYIVIEILVDKNVLEKRILGRRQCNSCGGTFNVFYDEIDDNKCPKCNNELFIRKDDTKEVFEKRLKLYEETVKPMLEYYEKNNKLKHLKAENDKKENFRKIEELIGVNFDKN